MLRYMALAAFLVGSAANGQSLVTTGNPSADELISTALAEQQVFHTCTILDKLSNDVVIENWSRMAENSATVLREAGVEQTSIDAFRAAASTDALLPAPDASLAEIRSFCNANPEWIRAFARLDFVILDLQLKQTFGQ